MNPGEPYVVGRVTAIHPGATLQNTVLGDGVTVEKPIVIKDSLVFPGVRVAAEQDIEWKLLTPEVTVDCGRH